MDGQVFVEHEHQRARQDHLVLSKSYLATVRSLSVALTFVCKQRVFVNVGLRFTLSANKA